jgi:sRNA-binding regulator protein Hfq
MSDQSISRPVLYPGRQNKVRTNIHILNGIRIHDPSVQAIEAHFPANAFVT